MQLVKGGQGELMARAFFTVWTPCPEQIGVDVGPDFDRPDNVSSPSGPRSWQLIL